MRQSILYCLLILICVSPAALAQDNKAYSRFDFTPGEKIVYYNQFDADPRGELPTGWNTNGSGEVVALRNQQWVKLLQNATFISDNTQSFTGDFSVEFDLLLDFKYQDALFPAFSFGFFGTGSDKPNSNAALRNIFSKDLLAVDLNAGAEQNSFAKLISYQAGSEYFNSGEKSFKQLEELLQQVIHISMQVQKGRFRLWVNENKLFDIPRAIPDRADINQLFFRVFESSYSNDQVGIYISNLKVAKGFPDSKHRLLTDGRFSTTGILFDVNSAVIKPVSYGIIREIAAVLKTDPRMKVLIVGHTDADGNDADNLLLSRKRSKAVMDLLVAEFGISTDVVSADGKGELQPVADNGSKEGKAQNRRVEFIKL